MTESRFECDVCLRRCALRRGDVGYCGIWRREGDSVALAHSFAVTERVAEPVEKKGLYHFRPGSLVYSVGSWGCNLHCSHCRNHQIACVRSPPEADPLPLADEVLASAQSAGCEGVAWGFAEPTLWHQTLCEINAAARERGLFSVVSTNGLASPAVQRRLVESGARVWKVDLKGFSAEAYRDAAGFPAWWAILDNLVALRASGCHLEISWCPIPGAEGTLEQARALGRWVASELGGGTPVHLNPFFPAHRRLNLPFGRPERLRQLSDVLREAGLAHVYLPQSLSSEERATRCGHCQALLVERPALGKPRLYTKGLNRCMVCGHSASLVF